jgi:hypothetical protein
LNSFRPIRTILFLGLLAFIGKNCFTTNRKVENLSRDYSAERNIFEVSSALAPRGQDQTYSEKHTFKVLDRTTLQGKVLHARVSVANSHGQDVILHYQDKDLVHVAAVLVGADQQISNHLRQLPKNLAVPGSPFSFEGANILYETSTWDDVGALDLGSGLIAKPGDPPAEEVDLENADYIGKKYHYFLVMEAE